MLWMASKVPGFVSQWLWYFDKPCEHLSCLRPWPPQLAWQRRHTSIPAREAGFLAALDKASISYHSGPEAIAAARQVCDWINQGQP